MNDTGFVSKRVISPENEIEDKCEYVLKQVMNPKRIIELDNMLRQQLERSVKKYSNLRYIPPKNSFLRKEADCTQHERQMCFKEYLAITNEFSDIDFSFTSNIFNNFIMSHGAIVIIARVLRRAKWL